MPLRNASEMERRAALFLDVDGTLVEIAPTPLAVHVPPHLGDILQMASQRVGGALALISGRAIRELDMLFAPKEYPAAGQHGLERRTVDGRYVRASVDDVALLPLRDALSRLQAQFKGLFFEDKGCVLAMHFRLAPQYESVVRGVMSELVAPLRGRFELRNGKCVIEVVPAGYSKRTAIEAFMQEPPFAHRVPVFIGDDVSDEDGFIAVNAMHGWSIRVGSSGNTVARHRFPDVATVIAWLDDFNFELVEGHEPTKGLSA